MQRFCDLHTHSNYSDGTFTPTQIIDAATEMSLSAVALTDHNNVDGLSEFMSAAQGKNIEAIPGVEFTTSYMNKELHIVALYVRTEYYSQIAQFTRKADELKECSNIELAQALNNAGYKIDYAHMKSKKPNGRINRADFAQELTDMGYIKCNDVAFKTILSSKNGLYVRPQRLSVFDVIGFVRDIGAVPVLAHPFLNLSYDELRAFLPLSKSHGLLGMEVEYTLFDKSERALAHKLADEFSLLKSGGSDFHGAKKPKVMLGTGHGALRVPLEWAHSIRQVATY